MGEFLLGDFYIEGRPLITPMLDVKIANPTYTAEELFPEIDYGCAFEASIDAIMRTTHIHGMFDMLAGDTDSKRAMRWIRYEKRRKEKRRRRMLKHG